MQNFLKGGILAITLLTTSLPFPQFIQAQAPSVEELKEVNSMAKRAGERSNLFDVPTELRPVIAASSAKFNVPEALLAALIKKESEFQNIWGFDGSGRGIAQIDSYWHPEVSDNEAFDPVYAISWAAKYLKGLLEDHGNWYNALRAYNGGPNFDSWRRGYGGMSVAYITQLYADTIYDFALDYAVKAKVEAIVEIPESINDIKSKSAELTLKPAASVQPEQTTKLIEEAKNLNCEELSCTLPDDFKNITNIANAASEVEPQL